MSKPIVIACAADARYALPLAVMLRSALVNLAPERRADVYVVDGGIAPDDRRRVETSLTDRAAVHWLAPQRAGFTTLPLWGHMPITTYDKLVIARLLPERVRKALWLDCDLLVLGDVARLYDQDLAGRHALALPDAMVPFVASRCGVAGYAELGIRRDAKYFNAGVIVLDVDLWRRDDVTGRALDYLKRYRRRVFFWDQEGLNAVLAGAWGEIDPRWNWRVGIDGALRAGQEHPWILHFSGNLKPWTYDARSIEHALYLRYLDMTAWAGWRPQRGWRSAALRFYESSGLRRVLYPAEWWGMWLVRAATLEYTPADEAHRHGP